MAKIDNLEDLNKDAESHLERGKIDERSVVNEKAEKIEITISRETYKRLLLNAASEGEPPSTAAARLLKTGLACPNEQNKVQQFLELKAASLGVSFGEIITKIYGHNKRKVRERKISRQSKEE